jgi:hypothetical protein
MRKSLSVPFCKVSGSPKTSHPDTHDCQLPGKGAGGPRSRDGHRYLVAPDAHTA